MAESLYQSTRSQVTTASEVRSLTGWDSGDVSDADIDAVVLLAQTMVLRRIARRHERLALDGERDGSNTEYQVPQDLAYRVVFDETLNLTTDGTDVLVEERTDSTDGTPPTWASATVSSIDANHGVITLSSAPADTVDAVELTAYCTARQVDLQAFKTSTQFLSAHLLQKRNTEHGAVNFAAPDIENIRTQAESGNWLMLYKHSLGALGTVAPVSVGVDTRLKKGSTSL